MVLRISHFPAFSLRGSHLDDIFAPKCVQEPPDYGSWGHLGAFLVVCFASSGRHLGPPALYEPCLVASWSQTVLPKPSKTIPKTFFGPKILKFPQILIQRSLDFYLIPILPCLPILQSCKPPIIQSSKLGRRNARSV